MLSYVKEEQCVDTLEPVCRFLAASDSPWWGSCPRPDSAAGRPPPWRSSHETWTKKTFQFDFFPLKRAKNCSFKVTKRYDLLSSVIFWPVVHLSGEEIKTVLEKKRQSEDCEQPRPTLPTHWSIRLNILTILIMICVGWVQHAGQWNLRQPNNLRQITLNCNQHSNSLTAGATLCFLKIDRGSGQQQIDGAIVIQKVGGGGNRCSKVK